MWQKFGYIYNTVSLDLSPKHKCQTISLYISVVDCHNIDHTVVQSAQQLLSFLNLENKQTLIYNKLSFLKYIIGM